MAATRRRGVYRVVFFVFLTIFFCFFVNQAYKQEKSISKLLKERNKLLKELTGAGLTGAGLTGVGLTGAGPTCAGLT